MIYSRVKYFFISLFNQLRKIISSQKRVMVVDGDIQLLNLSCISLENLKKEKISQFLMIVSIEDLLLNTEALNERIVKISEAVKLSSKRIPKHLIIVGHNKILGLHEFPNEYARYQLAESEVNFIQHWNAFSLSYELSCRYDEVVQQLQQSMTLATIDCLKYPLPSQHLRLDYQLQQKVWHKSIVKTDKMTEASSEIDDFLIKITNKKYKYKIFIMVFLILFSLVNLKLVFWQPFAEIKSLSHQLQQSTSSLKQNAVVFNNLVMTIHKKNHFPFRGNSKKISQYLLSYGMDVSSPVFQTLSFQLREYNKAWQLSDLTQREEFLSEYLQTYFTYGIFRGRKTDKILCANAMEAYLKSMFDLGDNLSSTIDFLFCSKNDFWKVNENWLTKAKNNLFNVDTSYRTFLVLKAIASGKKSVTVENIVEGSIFHSDGLDTFYLNPWDAHLKNIAEKLLLTLSTNQASYELNEVKKYFIIARQQAWMDFVFSIKPMPVNTRFSLENQLDYLIKNPDQIKKIVSFIEDNYAEDVNFPKQSFKEDLYFSALSTLYQTVKNNHSPSSDELSDASDLINSFSYHDNDMSQLVQRLLNMPFDNANNYFLKSHEVRIRQYWKTQIVPFYKRNLLNGYPFAKQGADVSLQKLSDFFHPEHGLYGIFSHREKKWPEDLSERIKQLNLLSHGLFHRGKQFGFSWSVRPDPMPGIQELVFQVGDTVINYQNGPQEWSQFSWSENIHEIGIYAYDAKHQLILEANSQGPWGLYRLIEKGEVHYLDKETLLVTWYVDRVAKVRFRIKLDDNGSFYLLRKKLLTL